MSFQKGGFSLAVSANNADSIALANFQVLVVEQWALEAFKGLGGPVHLEHVHARLVGRFEFAGSAASASSEPGLCRALSSCLHPLDHLLFG